MRQEHYTCINRTRHFIASNVKLLRRLTRQVRQTHFKTSSLVILVVSVVVTSLELKSLSTNYIVSFSISQENERAFLDTCACVVCDPWNIPYMFHLSTHPHEISLLHLHYNHKFFNYTSTYVIF